MKLPDFTPKDDVELYLINFFNVSRYKELSEPGPYNGLFDPLSFFNLFWYTHSLILLNKENPLKVLNYLLNLKFKPPQLCYLFENLLASFDHYLYPQFCPNKDDTELPICLEFITYECEKLSRTLHPENKTPNSLFNFSIIKKHTALIFNDNDKLIYLISVKTDYLQYVNINNISEHSAFDVLCDLEIEKIRRIIKLNSCSVLQTTQSSLPESNLQETPVSLQADQIKDFIADEICAVDAQKWNYIFQTKKDFMAFLNIFSDFFSGRKTTPQFNMILQPRCKTRFCTVLNAVYQHFKNMPLKKDNEFLDLLQNLSVFKNQNHSQIYHDIVRF